MSSMMNLFSSGHLVREAFHGDGLKRSHLDVAFSVPHGLRGKSHGFGQGGSSVKSSVIGRTNSGPSFFTLLRC